MDCPEESLEDGPAQTNVDPEGWQESSSTKKKAGKCQQACLTNSKNP